MVDRCSNDGLSVTAVPEEGYFFVGWSDGVSTPTRHDTNVVGDITATAVFSDGTNTVTASAGANGSVTPAGVTAVPWNGTQAYTITPAANHHVSDVLVDGVSVGAVTSYTFSNVTAAHTISATFAVDTNTVTASAGANGSVTPAGVTAVPWNGTQAYTITPAANHHVSDVLVDGVSVGAVTSYTFSSVTAAHTISATFAVDTNTVTASAGANGSVTPAGVTAVPWNGTQAYTITPAANHHVSDVLVDGVSAAR